MLLCVCLGQLTPHCYNYVPRSRPACMLRLLLLRTAAKLLCASPRPAPADGVRIVLPRARARAQVGQALCAMRSGAPLDGPLLPAAAAPRVTLAQTMASSTEEGREQNALKQLGSVEAPPAAGAEPPPDERLMARRVSSESSYPAEAAPNKGADAAGGADGGADGAAPKSPPRAGGEQGYWAKKNAPTDEELIELIDQTIRSMLDNGDFGSL
eukprot:5759089-Prymnesium_polylepis.1